MKIKADTTHYITEKVWTSIVYFLIAFISPVWAEVEIGAYLGTSFPTKGDVVNFENKVDHHVASVILYTAMSPFGVNPIPQSVMDAVYYHDGYPTEASLQVTFEPWVPLSDISAGKYDYNISAFVDDLASYPGTIRFRFGHEMIQDDIPNNGGEWYPLWQDHPEEYKAAYRHVWNLFKEKGVNNVEFVWCPNQHISDYAVLEKYYPGKEYVDWIGIDGYGYPGTSFDTIFEAIYKAIVEHPEIFGDKDIMLGEFAAMEGDYKAAWIQDAFNKIKAEYDKIKAVYWFDIDKEHDWRIDSDKNSLEAFREAISDPYFVGHPIDGDGDNSGDSPEPQEPVRERTIHIKVNVPAITQFVVSVHKVNSDNSWSDSNEVDFGLLSFDERNRVFRSSVYYVVDVGVMCNKGRWQLIHEPGSIVGPNGNTLDFNVNVTFVNMKKGGKEEVIKKLVYARSRQEFSSRVLKGNWLRVYYGLATGVADAPGAKPVGLGTPSGKYVGSITLTLVVN